MRVRIGPGHRLSGFGPGRPALFAHRGASKLAAENTLAAFEAARRAGVDGVEFDVRRCASGELVVIHDTELTRLTGEAGCVEEMSCAQVRERRVLGTEQRIPRLEEVLESIGPDMLLDVELKLRSHQDQQLVANVAALLGRPGIVERTIVTSFEPLPLRAMHRLRPEIVTGLLYGDESPWYLRRALAARLIGAACVAVQHKFLNHRLVESRHGKGLSVLAWTVNDLARARELIGMRVDGLIGDDPEVLLAARQPSEAADERGSEIPNLRHPR